MCRTSPEQAPRAILAFLESGYGWHDVTMGLLARGGGEVYTVTSGSQRAILKIFAPGFAAANHVEHHLLFAEHLNQRGVACPCAIPLTDRSRVGFLGDGRIAVLYDRTPHDPSMYYSPVQAAHLGATVADMHAAAARFQRRETYPRFNLDWFLLAPTRAILKELRRLNLSTSPLLLAVARLEADLVRGSVPACWAICHGDLHPSNACWDADRPMLIDFDHSRLAPVALDIGFFCLLGTAKHNHSRKLQDHFLRVYQSARLLSEADLLLIPAMMAGFHLFAFGHHCRYQRARYPEITRDYLVTNLESLARYGGKESPYAIDGPPHELLGGALDGAGRRVETNEIRRATAG